MTTTQPRADRDSTDRGVVDDAAIGHDDYSLSRVPENKRYSWVTMATQRFGMLSSLAQFFIGASLGFGMSFWDAMLAVVLGSVLLEFVTVFVGIAGQREGLSTSLLARWTGFGTIGAALLGLVLSVSLVGWFGVQTEVFAMSLMNMVPLPKGVLAFVGGLLVTFIVVYGIRWMNWVAFVSVPLFLLLVMANFFIALKDHNIAELMGLPAGATPLSMATAITMVAGGFIAGAIFTPDLSRYNRSAGDVVKQTVVGVTLGQFFVAVLGVLLAHSIKATTQMEAVGQVTGLLVNGLASYGLGFLGVIIVCLSVIKVNDWNLYPSSLGLTNALQGLFGLKINRVWVAVGLGLAGSIVAAVGMASGFAGFLNILGTLFPPIAAIMIVDYFILKTHRRELDESRADGDRLPATAPLINPAGLIAWFVGTTLAFILSAFPQVMPAINIPAIIALVVTFGVYWALGAAGLAKGVGSAVTPQPERSHV